MEPFRLGLRDWGYEEGVNIILEPRFTGGGGQTIEDAIAELIAVPVDVIVTANSELTHVAKELTATVPIIMASSTNPVEQGLVMSLARPGGNVTGISLHAGPLSAKRLELLKDLVPTIARVAVLWNTDNPAMAFEVETVVQAAQALGIELHLLPVRAQSELEPAIDGAALAGAEGILVLADRLTFTNHATIAKLAMEHKLLSSFASSDGVKAGGLMSYAPDLAPLWRQVARYVDKVLQGSTPAGLPVEQPMTFELTLNRHTAAVLGIDNRQMYQLLPNNIVE